jgi:hypothetical protein
MSKLHKKMVIATRVTQRQMERIARAAYAEEQSVGEFLRLAALREVERRERNGKAA